MEMVALETVVSPALLGAKEKEAWITEPKLSMSQWADKYRFVGTFP